jgi:hypothetical protein
MALNGVSPIRERALAIIGERFDARRAARAFGPLWQVLAAELSEEGQEPS